MSLLQQIVEGLHVAKIEGLAKTFTRLGRIGCWLLMFRTTQAAGQFPKAA
ncbi:hypothetical protein [Candidatus Thiodictyon syntrophicum]|nr:hypothetical protein [Candidatus Thiodictyon syntrophicum]